MKLIALLTAIAFLKTAKGIVWAAAPVPHRLADLERHACRWPVNDASISELHLFCGERAAATKPYCTRHCRLAYRVPPASVLEKKDRHA